MKLPENEATSTRGVPPFVTDEKAVNDYYPFGMTIADRSYSTAGYRYGYNGKENDNEVKGTGNSIDYGARIYDPRISKFLSVDPLTKSYPMLTPYQFGSNRPIDGVDLDGKEWFSMKNESTGEMQYTVKIKVIRDRTQSAKQFQQNLKNIAIKTKDVFQGNDGKTQYTTNVEFNVVEENEVDRSKDFYMEFVDEIPEDKKAGGYTQEIGNTTTNRIQILRGQNPAVIAEIGAHEIGHTGVLGMKKMIIKYPSIYRDPWILLIIL